MVKYKKTKTKMRLSLTTLSCKKTIKSELKRMLIFEQLPGEQPALKEQISESDLSKIENQIKTLQAKIEEKKKELQEKYENDPRKQQEIKETIKKHEEELKKNQKDYQGKKDQLLSEQTKNRNKIKATVEGTKESQEYDEKNLKSFMENLEKRQKDEKSAKEFHKWANQQKESELLRRANVDAVENTKDYNEKHLRLAAEYLSSSKEKLNGHLTFNIDFKGNEVAEWKIGAAHTLPPNVKTIRIYDESGKILFNRAERKIVKGKLGYFDIETGQYAYIHTGYKVEVLTIQSPDHEETKKRVSEELDWFDKEQRKIVIKNELQSFFTARGIEGLVIDDTYFETSLGQLLEKLPQNWWEQYVEKKFSKKEFEQLFEKEFQQDIIFLKNVTHLRNQGAKEQIFMSDYTQLRTNEKFAPLKMKEMSPKELEEFKQKNLENKDVSDFTLESHEVMSNEPFVKSVDHLGKPVVLRRSAMIAFEKAKKIAESMGVKLNVRSSYRDFDQQTGIHNNAIKKYGSSEAASKWAARPGESPHHAGGTIDIVALVNGKGGLTHPNQELLKEILPRAKFVNYSLEPWHWEIHTRRWQNITSMSGPIYEKEYHLDRTAVAALKPEKAAEIV